MISHYDDDDDDDDDDDNNNNNIITMTLFTCSSSIFPEVISVKHNMPFSHNVILVVPITVAYSCSLTTVFHEDSIIKCTVYYEFLLFALPKSA